MIYCFTATISMLLLVCNPVTLSFLLCWLTTWLTSTICCFVSVNCFCLVLPLHHLVVVSAAALQEPPHRLRQALGRQYARRLRSQRNFPRQQWQMARPRPEARLLDHRAEQRVAYESAIPQPTPSRHSRQHDCDPIQAVPSLSIKRNGHGRQVPAAKLPEPGLTWRAEAAFGRVYRRYGAVRSRRCFRAACAVSACKLALLIGAKYSYGQLRAR